MEFAQPLVKPRMVPWSSRSALSQDCPLWLSLRPLFFGFVRFVWPSAGGCFRDW